MFGKEPNGSVLMVFDYVIGQILVSNGTSCLVVAKCGHNVCSWIENVVMDSEDKEQQL